MESLILALLQSTGLLKVDPKGFRVTNCPTQKGDEVLGELNELEKACRMLLEEKQKEHKDLHTQIEKLGSKDSSELSKIQYQHHLLSLTEEVVRNMMWLSITQRFQVGEKVKRGSSFAIRDYNKVVLTAPEKERPGDFFSKMLSGGGGITVIEMGILR